MFLFLSKLLPLLVYPPALTILLIFAALLVIKRRPRTATIVLVVAAVSLYLLSTNFIAEALQRNLESRYPALDVQSVPKGDAIVVLGGYLRTPAGERRTAELTESADRLRMGALLYQAGKAPIVLLTGGNIPFLGSTGIPEAEAAKKLLHEWGVPDDAILVEPASQNTHENAAFSKPLLAARGAHKLLLVTSALHMPRAVAIFRREGLDVTPVPTDYQSGWGEPDFAFELVPDAEALARSKAAAREWIGLAVYQILGWA